MRKFLHAILLALLSTGALAQTALTTSGVQTVTGTKTFNNSKLCLAGSTSGTTCISAPAIAGSSTAIIFPSTAGTLPLVENPLSQFASTTSAQLAGVISDETGSGPLVFATSPTLTTPTLGAATATSINKVAITAPATSATLTIANGKTLTANNSIGLSGTDGTTMTFPSTSATIARTDAAQTFTGTQTFSSAPINSAATAGRVAFAGSSKEWADSSNLTFNNSTGNLSVNGGSSAEVITAQGSQNQAAVVKVTGPNSSAAYTAFTTAQVNGNTMDLSSTGSAWTPTGIFLASQNNVAAFQSGGLNVIAGHASGVLNLATGGTALSNIRMSIGATGTVTLSDGVNIATDTTNGSKIGTSASQKLGFWNATPIVQPTTAGAAATFVANTSAIANDTATFDGYTIGQVVKALRNAGLLQ